MQLVSPRFVRRSRDSLVIIPRKIQSVNPFFYLFRIFFASKVFVKVSTGTNRHDKPAFQHFQHLSVENYLFRHLILPLNQKLIAIFRIYGILIIAGLNGIYYIIDTRP